MISRIPIPHLLISWDNSFYLWQRSSLVSFVALCSFFLSRQLWSWVIASCVTLWRKGLCLMFVIFVAIWKLLIIRAAVLLEICFMLFSGLKQLLNMSFSVLIYSKFHLWRIMLILQYNGRPLKMPIVCSRFLWMMLFSRKRRGEGVYFLLQTSINNSFPLEVFQFFSFLLISYTI